MGADRGPRAWIARRGRWVGWALVSLAVALSFGAGVAATLLVDDADQPGAASDTGAAALPPVSEIEEEPLTPEPLADTRLNCDFLLGDQTDRTETGYRMVAGGEVMNTGNVGVIVEVTARWSQLGAEARRESDRVRVAVGESREVQITVLSDGNEYDAYSSADFDCDVDGEIVDTFGQPQPLGE